MTARVHANRHEIVAALSAVVETNGESERGGVVEAAAMTPSFAAGDGSKNEVAAGFAQAVDSVPKDAYATEQEPESCGAAVATSEMKAEVG